MRRLPASLLRGSRDRRGLLGAAVTIAFLAGGLLILWSAYIHFHLWDEAFGYRHISVIGPLFLAQAIGGLVVGVLVVAVRRVWAALVGIGFAASTAVGFLLSVGLAQGLFNFKESWRAPYANLAFGIEVAIVAVLSLAAACSLTRAAPAPDGPLSPAPAVRRRDRPLV